MTQPLRPALGEVLGALTDLPAAVWGAWPADDVRVDDRGALVELAVPPRLATGAQFTVGMGPVPWVTRSPREALEILQTRDVVPAGAWRFACGTCLGVGLVTTGRDARRVACPACAPDCPACRRAGLGDGVAAEDCPDCDGVGSPPAEVSPGFHDAPVTIPALVAWASLGFAPVWDEGGELVAPGVTGAEEIAARELLAGGAVSWRVARLAGAHRPADAPGTLRRMGLLPLRGIDGVQVVVPPLERWS